MGESLLALTAKVMPLGKLSVTPASETVGAALAEARAGKTVVADRTMIELRSSAAGNEKCETGNGETEARRIKRALTAAPPPMPSRSKVAQRAALLGAQIHG